MATGNKPGRLLLAQRTIKAVGVHCAGRFSFLSDGNYTINARSLQVVACPAGPKRFF